MTTEAKPKGANKSGKLTPEQRRRKIALLDAGLTAADVAREAGVTRQHAWLVLMDRATSSPVQDAFLRLVGGERQHFFPESTP